MGLKTRLNSNWHELKGKIRQKWARLTDNDIELAKGNAEEFFGKIEQLYGTTKESVKRDFHSIVDEEAKNPKYAKKNADQEHSIRSGE